MSVLTSVRLDQNVPYLAVRTCLWLGLAILQFFHVLRSAVSGNTPRALAAGLAVGSALFASRDFVSSIYYGVRGYALVPILQTVNCMAEAYFLGILMVISAGYCITTNFIFGDAKRNAIVLPILYFIVTTTVAFMSDYIDNRGPTALYSASFSTFFIVMVFSQLALLMTMWFTIFDSSDQVYKNLAEQQARRGLRQPASPMDDTTPSEAQRPAPEEDIEGGYNNITDEPTTVAEAVDLNAKFKLISRFRAAVAFYMLATIAAIILPVVFTDSQGMISQLGSNMMTIILNIMLLVFMLCLAWVFRISPDSPYLLINDELDTIPLDTSLGGSAPVVMRRHQDVDVQMANVHRRSKSPMAESPRGGAVSGASGRSPRQRSPRRSPRLAAQALKVPGAHGASNRDESVVLPGQGAGGYPGIDDNFKLDDDE